jgi:hypothetical protein
MKNAGLILSFQGRNMKNLIILVLIHLSTYLFAQEAFHYQLKGSYKLRPSDKKSVEYILRWSDLNGKIAGEYSDNFFTDSTKVSGHESDLGRDFSIDLPIIKDGVKSLTFLFSKFKSFNHNSSSVPVSIISRDRRGNPITTSIVDSKFLALSLVPQKQEEKSRQEGLGALAGYCGLYEGLVSEYLDKRNKCNLLFASAVKLELTEDQTLILHLGDVNSLVKIPSHVIGRLPINPETTFVDVIGRQCRPLQGVNAPGDSCKLINLTGRFSIKGEHRHFSGTYSIKEEGTNNFCQYTLSMDLTNQ